MGATVAANAADKSESPSISAAHADKEGFNNESHRAMMKMHTEMEAHKSTGDADADFAEMMALHHKGAVEMSQIYLKYQKNSELKTMAEKMIVDQQKEIKQLKTIAAQESKQMK